MTFTSRAGGVLHAIAIVAGGSLLSLPAQAATPNDSIYVHCDNNGGDFRISELNHSVSQYSDRYRDYRPLCSECDITEWGNKITMKDGGRTFIQINRLSGFVLLQRSREKGVPGPSDISSFQGTCKRGAAVVPQADKRIAGRAF